MTKGLDFYCCLEELLILVLVFSRYFCETLLDFYDPCPVKEELRLKIVGRLIKEGSNADEPANIALSDYSSLRWEICKVEKFWLPCLHLISSSSHTMKFQIMGGKMTENLGFKSLLRKVKIVLSFFLFVTIFEHLVLQNREYASKPAVFFFNKKSGTKGGWWYYVIFKN